jgi:hypothetical protein
MEPNREDSWASDQLAALEPQWRPDFTRGRALLDAGVVRKTRSLRWAAAGATVGLCFVALAFPQTRAFAQQIWYHFVLKRLDVVRLDLSKLPLQVQVIGSGETEVHSLVEAELRAGFRPYLPMDGMRGNQPRITISGPTTIEATVRTKDLAAALPRVGAGGVEVPAEWEGVQLRVAVGSVVTADYAEDVRVQQMRMIDLSIPMGFPLERFAEAAFRSLGSSTWESRALAQKFASNPGWFLDIPPNEIVHIQEVPLRTGHALVIEDHDNEGRVWIPWTVTVVRNSEERVYAVSANDRQLALRVIESLP